MNNTVISKENLTTFCEAAFHKAGMTQADAAVCSDVLVVADAMGFYSHGTKNLLGYIRKAEAGGVDFSAKPVVVRDLPSFSLVDAKNALGMIPSCMAVEKACEKARVSGIAMVSVVNSCHFGAAGYYANLAAKQGMVGISMSNVDPNMAVPGSRGKVIGNNPIAFAAPSRDVPSVFLDISMSSTASLKVLQAKERGQRVPDGWIVDKEGIPTNDPSSYPDEGALQSMGAHKGYGLALMVEMLTGALTGGGTSIGGGIPSWCFNPEEPNRVSHSFIVVDVSSTSDYGVFERQIRAMEQGIHEAPCATGCEMLHLPGERSWERYARAMDEGIAVPEDTLRSLKELSNHLEVPWTF